jgi:hypothetical protein
MFCPLTILCCFFHTILPNTDSNSLTSETIGFVLGQLTSLNALNLGKYWIDILILCLAWCLSDNVLSSHNFIFLPYYFQTQVTTVLVGKFQHSWQNCQTCMYWNLVSILNAYTYSMLYPMPFGSCFVLSLFDVYPILFPNTDNNSLEGSIPTELGDLIKLQLLRFSKYIKCIHYMLHLKLLWCCVILMIWYFSHTISKYRWKQTYWNDA